MWPGCPGGMPLYQWKVYLCSLFGRTSRCYVTCVCADKAWVAFRLARDAHCGHFPAGGAVSVTRCLCDKGGRELTLKRSSVLTGDHIRAWSTMWSQAAPACTTIRRWQTRTYLALPLAIPKIITFCFASINLLNLIYCPYTFIHVPWEDLSNEAYCGSSNIHKLRRGNADIQWYMQEDNNNYTMNMDNKYTLYIQTMTLNSK